MGTGKTTSTWRLLLLLGLLATLIAAAPADAKKKRHKAHPFGSRVLAPGTRGKDVRFLQRSLTKLGIATGVDGAYGKGTMKSMKALEAQKGWPVDGIASKKDEKRILKLLSKGTATGGYFIFGYTSPGLTLTAKRGGSATVKATDASGTVVQTIPVTFTGAGSQHVGWNGGTASGYPPDGTYQLKLADPGSAKAAVSGGDISPFGMHLRAFPVPGTHDFGGPDARFGAPRSGHTHQGQDVPAACGSRLLVVETGRVSVNAYQATGAGYYVVIHGTVSGSDFVYMHLTAASWAPAGTNVFAGQQIGKVGATGDAQGCHLHFERWSAPGWYVGGAPYDPLAELLYWDSYS